MPYIGKDPGTGLRGRFIYTATAGQTSFTGSDSLGRTLTYTDSEYTDVFLNGVKLDKTDYTATSGTSIVLDSGASADDTLEILAFDTFGLFSGEFAQDVSVSGDLTISDKIVHSGDTNTAIRFAAADTVTVETAGSERLRIDSSGNVGINETAPTVPLTVKGAQAFGSSASNLSTSTTKAAVRIRGSSDSSTSLFFGSITNDAEQYIQSANGAGSAADDIILNPFGGNVMVGQGSSERTRVDTSGRLLIGITAPTTTGAYFEPSSLDRTVLFLGSSNATSGITLLVFSNPNGIVGGVSTNASSTSYNTSSDYRLKENVADLTGAIDRVKTLAPKRFNFIADPDTTVDGFLAHEVTAVPEAITGTKDATEAIGDVKDADGNIVESKVVKPQTLEDGHTWTETGTRPVYQGIDQSKLVPVLTAALQEAIAKIETLETKVAALEG